MAHGLKPDACDSVKPEAVAHQPKALVSLPCKRVQCDEIWSYVDGKDKNPSQSKKDAGLGSIWTWTALDADSKLIASWLVGLRDAGSAYGFMQDAPHIALRSHRTARRRAGCSSPSTAWAKRDHLAAVSLHLLRVSR